MELPILEQMVRGLLVSLLPTLLEDLTYEMFPHDLASDLGMQTMSSLQIGTISIEYVNL
jgi:hypothetical protein